MIKRFPFFILAIMMTGGFASACIDIPQNLYRYEENDEILAVQNFFFAKGLLKATPNGYYGPGTYRAVIAYQKENNIRLTGTLGPITRSALKKETCSTELPSSPLPSVSLPQASATTTTATSTASALPSSKATSTTPLPLATTTPPLTPTVATTTVVTQTCFFTALCDTSLNYSSGTTSKPAIISLNRSLFLRGALINKNLVISGKAFASYNRVFLRSLVTGKQYLLGDFSSDNGSTITVDSQRFNDALVCGASCEESPSAGDYVLYVKNGSGESGATYISLKSYTTSTVTASAIPVSGQGIKIATVRVRADIPLVFRTLTLYMPYGATMPINILSNVSLKETVDGTTYPFSSIGEVHSVDFAKLRTVANQSKTYDIYADVKEGLTGAKSIYSGYLVVQDSTEQAEFRISLQDIVITR
jgi:peptidoglycan hydrolase-like protein with peptidoglycan-binding domain